MSGSLNSNNQEIALVTGGAGFIGSHTTRFLLDKGFKVIVVDNFSNGSLANLSDVLNNADLEILHQDICDLDVDEKSLNEIDFVYHFAGIGDIVPSINNPKDYFYSNVEGTLRLAECFRSKKLRKFVYAASSSCYGIAEVPTKETNPINPMHPYALTKYLAEEILLHWCKVYKLPVISIRIFNAYGPRARTSGNYGAVFGVFMKQKLEGKPYTVVGDGEQLRDFVHVSDVANAFWLASKSDYVGRIYNLGRGEPVSINEIVDLLGGDRVSIPWRPGEPQVTWADVGKIRDELDWHPEIDIETGIQDMIANIELWRDAPLWSRDSILETTKTWFEFLEGSEIGK